MCQIFIFLRPSKIYFLIESLELTNQNKEERFGMAYIYIVWAHKENIQKLGLNKIQLSLDFSDLTFHLTSFQDKMKIHHSICCLDSSASEKSLKKVVQLGRRINKFKIHASTQFFNESL